MPAGATALPHPDQLVALSVVDQDLAEVLAEIGGQTRPGSGSASARRWWAGSTAGCPKPGPAPCSTASRRCSASSVTSTATSPFLSSYQGLDSATLNTLSSLQSGYHQQAPEQNQQTALQDLYSARDTADPQLRAALIADAVKQLTPAGVQPLQLGADATGGPVQAVGANPIATAPTAAAPAAADTTGSDPSLPADATGNTVDTGRCLITASNAQGGQLTIHDKETGKDTVVWGDPHISVGGKDTARFQSNGLTIKLGDGTEVQIQPTAKDGGGHAYINQVAVTKGDQAVTMSGFHGGDLHTSGAMNGQAAATQQAYSFNT